MSSHDLKAPVVEEVSSSSKLMGFYNVMEEVGSPFKPASICL